VLVELPFVTRDEVAERFRLGHTTKTKSAIETLRRRGLLSDGITRPLRDQEGKTRGTLRLYSPLTCDAAALAAVGDGMQAEGFVAIGQQLEKRSDAGGLADVLAIIGGSLPTERRTVAIMCKQAAVSQPEIVKQLSTYAAAIVHARKGLSRGSEVALGYVWSLKGTRAEIKLLDGSIVPVPRDQLGVTPGDALGSPIAIRWTALGGGIWMTTEPALDVPTPDEGMYPFERGEGQKPITVPTAVLDGPVTIRRSGRTTVVD
jgi:hypothetical protein